MLETAAALLIVEPLAALVFKAIAGGAARDKFKKLWDLPRKDVDDVEVALLQAALQTVVDSHKQCLKEDASRLTKDEKRGIKEKIKEFKETHDALRWEDPGYAKQRLSEWTDKVSAMPDAPGGEFGPLVAYACTDIPPVVRDALTEDFAPALRVHFHRKLRDSDVLFRIFTVEVLSEFREVIAWWRDLHPDREAKLVEQVARTGEGVSLLIGKVVELERKMDELPERIRAVVLGCLQQAQREPAQLAVIIEQLPQIVHLARDLDATTQTAEDRRDLLKSYPEPQPQWVGRVVERGQLGAAWLPARKMIYTIVGFGGQGKSALARRFTESLRRLEKPEDRPLVVWWSFYLNRSADEFFDQAAVPLNIPLHDEESDRRRNSVQIAGDMIDRMRAGVGDRRVLLVLDGLEVMQETTTGRIGRIKDVALYGLLKGILDDNKPDTPASGMILSTTRDPLTDLTPDEHRPFTSVELGQLTVTDGADLLINLYGLNIHRDEAEEFAAEVAGHALTLTLTGTLLRKAGATSATVQELREFIVSEEAGVTDPDLTARKEKFHRLPGYVLRHCAGALDDEHRQIMRLLSCCVRPATRLDIEEVFLQYIGSTREERRINNRLRGNKYTDLRNGPILHLRELHLIDGDEKTGYDMHPLIRSHFYQQESDNGRLTDVQRRAVHALFFEVLQKRQPKHHPDTMAEMEPLIDAVLHGCRAAIGQRALDDVYYTRIERGDTGRTTAHISADLGASETTLQLLRAFFPDGNLSAEPRVTVEADKALLIGGAALALMNTGRPTDALPLFERAAEMRRHQSLWANRSSVFLNLSELFGYLGGLPDAFEAAAKALANIEKVLTLEWPKPPHSALVHAYSGGAAAQRGQDAVAGGHFESAIALSPENWLWGIRGAWHCTWLARGRDFDRARKACEKNVAEYAEKAGLHERTFVFATQALVERLACAADDPRQKPLDEMQGFAEEAVKVGKRSGHHYYYTRALLEAGRCAAARAGYERDHRDEHVVDAKRYLAEAESRADYAGYRLIHADIHVTRAQLARLDGDEQAVNEQCDKAIGICDDPDCDYAWARQDAQALLDDVNSET